MEALLPSGAYRSSRGSIYFLLPPKNRRSQQEQRPLADYALPGGGRPKGQRVSQRKQRSHRTRLRVLLAAYTLSIANPQTRRFRVWCRLSQALQTLTEGPKGTHEPGCNYPHGLAGASVAETSVAQLQACAWGGSGPPADAEKAKSESPSGNVVF